MSNVGWFQRLVVINFVAMAKDQFLENQITEVEHTSSIQYDK